MRPVLLADERIQDQVGPRGVQEQQLAEFLAREATGQTLERSGRSRRTQVARRKALVDDIVQAASRDQGEQSRGQGLV
ncbi:hypothetical protein D3C78_1627680 [compost metagenome]